MKQAELVMMRKARSQNADLNLKTMGVLWPESVADYKRCPEHIATLHSPDQPPWPYRLLDPPRSNLQQHQHQQQQHLSRERGQFGSNGKSNGAGAGKEAGAGFGVENENFVPEFDRELETPDGGHGECQRNCCPGNDGGLRGGREQRGQRHLHWCCDHWGQDNWRGGCDHGDWREDEDESIAA